LGVTPRIRKRGDSAPPQKKEKATGSLPKGPAAKVPVEGSVLKQNEENRKEAVIAIRERERGVIYLAREEEST